MLTKRKKVDAECRALMNNGRTNTFLSKMLQANRLPVVLLSALFY